MAGIPPAGLEAVAREDSGRQLGFTRRRRHFGATPYHVPNIDQGPFFGGPKDWHCFDIGYMLEHCFDIVHLLEHYLVFFWHAGEA
jgi:hypothetical protein